MEIPRTRSEEEQKVLCAGGGGIWGTRSRAIVADERGGVGEGEKKDK